MLKNKGSILTICPALKFDWWGSVLIVLIYNHSKVSFLVFTVVLNDLVFLLYFVGFKINNLEKHKFSPKFTYTSKVDLYTKVFFLNLNLKCNRKNIFNIQNYNKMLIKENTAREVC